MAGEAAKTEEKADEEAQGGKGERGSVSSVLWMLPTAITFTKFYREVFEFGHDVVELCERLTGFARAAWHRGFTLVPHWVPITVDDRTMDLLTLWVTSSFIVLALPRLTGEKSALPRTTISAVQDTLKLSELPAQLIASVLIAISAFVIAAPFEAALATLHASSVLSPGGAAVRQWLGGRGIWLTFVVMGLALCAVGYVYFVHNPKLAKLTPSAQEKREFTAVSALLWLLSAAFLILALFVPLQGWHLGALVFLKDDSMVLSLLALAGLITWRSALPFVQLACLIVAIFFIDGAYKLALDAWAASK